MNPMSMGDNAFGALETVNGGNAGPSNANSNASQDFWGGSVTVGSPVTTGVNIWVVLALIGLGVWCATRKS